MVRLYTVCELDRMSLEFGHCIASRVVLALVVWSFMLGMDFVGVGSVGSLSALYYTPFPVLYYCF